MSPPRTPATPTPPLSSTRSATPISDTSGSLKGVPQRDPGVSDEVWSQLQAARRAAEEEARKKKEEIARLQRSAAEAEKEAKLQKQIQEQRERQLAEERDAARRAELEEQRKVAEEQERRIREERERLARLMKAAQQAEAERRRKEEAVQQKLRSLGICPAGYRWIATGGGYRCSAGGHFVSAAQLGL
jgi:Ni/Co efflux regulator RcnB